MVNDRKNPRARTLDLAAQARVIEQSPDAVLDELKLGFLALCGVVVEMSERLGAGIDLDRAWREKARSVIKEHAGLLGFDFEGTLSPNVWRILDDTADHPYQQLADQIRQQILTGAYPPGGRLPTVDRVVKAHGVAPDTIRRAYRVLAAEGLVAIVPGRGNFVASEDDLRVVRLNLGGSDRS
jgi:GntR family transcriptional regulator